MPIAETMPVGRRRAARPVLRIVLCLVATASATLALAGCGGPTSTPGDLFHAYAESTDVINDEFTGSATGADRLAEFAAEGTPSDIEGELFSAFQCADAPTAGGAFKGQLGCPPDGAVNGAVASLGGSAAVIYERNILIEHQGGQLELMPLYVTVNSTGTNVLIDTDGTVYPGGLDDFREHNQLLTDEDQILVPANITATSGGGVLEVVTGHTWQPSAWLIIGIVVVLLIAVAAVVMLIRRRRDRRFDEALAADSTPAGSTVDESTLDES